jgi:PAS domain S-box-containing protein
MTWTEPIRLLVVEDDEDDFFLLEKRLKKSSFQKQIKWANSFEKAREFLKSESADLVIIDYRLGAHTGLELVAWVNDHFPFTPTILLTGLRTTNIDQEALRSGVYDYLVKDQYTEEEIDRSIRYAIEKSKVLKSLKESENKFKNLFENSVEYVILTDADHTILDANKSALKLFNFTSKDKLIGLNIEHYISPNIFESGKEVNSSLEIEIIIPELNKKTWCILNSSVVDFEKNIHQLVLHDITERKLNERKEKLLEKQALTGKVARLIAHEIKNPLTSIHLSLSELRMIMKEEDGPGDDSPGELLNIIERNSRRINSLIEDLLNATRFETLNFSDIRLIDLLEESLSHIRDRIQLKKIRIEKNFGPELMIRGDSEKLVIALLNVMVNAVEAIGENQKGKLSITTFLEDETASIIITDNGKGIPAADLPHLFEPFFTSKKGGTGLGLAAAYTIIAKHDGIIKVKSEPGKETSFTIVLPVKK